MDQIKIYLVEDSSIIRDNLIDALHESAPIDIVGCADDERSAVAWFRDGNECDLVIIDIFLKQGSGLGVLRSCTQRPPHSKLAVFSNYATPDMREKCYELGADAVFDKSNEIDALIAFCTGLGATSNA